MYRQIDVYRKVGDVYVEMCNIYMLCLRVFKVAFMKNTCIIVEPL